MTEAKDIYKTLLVGSFLSSVWMQSQKSEHFTAVLAGKVKDTCQWATSCTSWRNLLCQLLSNPLPSSRLLCDTCCFSYLKIYAHCLLKRCCMYLWGWQHWSCLLCNGQPESALKQAVLGNLTYATCKERPGQSISWKGSEWGLSFQKSLFDQRLLFGLWIPCFFPLTYEPNIHLGLKLCSLWTGPTSIPARLLVVEDPQGWLQSAGGMFEWVDKTEQWIHSPWIHSRWLPGYVHNENREV